MSEQIDTNEYKGYEIQVYLDESPPNPRKDYDNLGSMICFHSRYNLGDEKGKGAEHPFSGPEALVEHVGRDDVIALPLYLYDHSGITMNTTGFSCPWDSGQVGFIYVDKEQVRKEWGWKLITKMRQERIEELLRGEVEEYDHYLTGNVYGYVIVHPDDPGEDLDCCWGFFGDPEDFMLGEARDAVDWIVKEKEVAQWT